MIEHKVIDSYGQGRADKYIMHLLPGLTRGLMYKQMRNKNITLNGAKINGNEKVKEGDILRFYFSDETFNNFSKGTTDTLNHGNDNPITIYKNNMHMAEVVYENDHIIVMNKPSGILSQKRSKNDISLNEWMLGYLLDKGDITEESMTHYKPSVLNRLDRNTSGLIMGGKTLKAARIVGDALRGRTVHKYYKTVVWGKYALADGIYEAMLSKDSSTNMVNISTELVNADKCDKSAIIRTGIKLLEVRNFEGIGSQSVLEIELFTGKSHQIRAHLSALGYPIVGDPKYGNPKLDSKCKDKITEGQILHAYRLEFDPTVMKELNIDRQSIVCDVKF